MSRERAEAYLRLRAEEELRRPAWPRRVRWAAVACIRAAASRAGFPCRKHARTCSAYSADTQESDLEKHAPRPLP